MEFLTSVIVLILLIIPAWIILKKAGKNPAISLFIIFPFVGLLLVYGILAHSRWPALQEPVG